MKPEIVQFEEAVLELVPHPEHGWMMPTEEVAKGYGVDPSNIRSIMRTDRRRTHPEYVEGKHFSRVMINHSRGNLVQNAIFWTQRGVIRLGFAIRSDRARRFRDFAEDLALQRLSPQPVPVPPPPYPLAVRCHVCQSPLRSQIDQMLSGHSRKPDGSRYRYEEIVRWAAQHGTHTSAGGLSRHLRHLEEGLVSPKAMIPRFLRELAKRDPADIPTAQLARITELLTRQYELGLGNTA